MWYDGTKPKHAPTPTFDTDEKRKEEEAHTERSAGLWGVPKCLFKEEWGEKISVEKKFREKTRKKEDYQILFSTTMPPCIEVISIVKARTRRKITTISIGVLGCFHKDRISPIFISVRCSNFDISTIFRNTLGELSLQNHTRASLQR